MAAGDRIQLRNPDPAKKGARIRRDKLDLEARGELRRSGSPQRLTRA